MIVQDHAMQKNYQEKKDKKYSHEFFFACLSSIYVNLKDEKIM